MGILKERTIKSHWSTPQLGVQRPKHSIKFMPYWKFQLIHRHLRPFDHSKIDETAPLPKLFQAADEWSDHIQAVSAEIFVPGPHLAVDECMIRYPSRSNETTLVKGKQDPLGFKIWVIAQQGFFIRWLWHIKEAKYSAVGVEHPPPKSSRQGRGGRRGSRGRGAAKATGKKPAKEDKPIALNSTQSVVVALANMLPKATYHVFVDDLFSSSDLFRSLRKHGHGGTGTARPNCGIDKKLQQDKKADWEGPKPATSLPNSR
ncbi:ac transposable element-derived 4 [Fusarium beomiforme]|uniref:Ac transposable element-derived 4 n=1 Tax=Fusarium beomiforme TaxID=44412 RepID=A0A9P5A9N9_9HYPO|nr:ac transposable element-derived 4 [Fusarium beomiforme]